MANEGVGGMNCEGYVDTACEQAVGGIHREGFGGIGIEDKTEIEGWR